MRFALLACTSTWTLAVACAGSPIDKSIVSSGGRETGGSSGSGTGNRGGSAGGGASDGGQNGTGGRTGSGGASGSGGRTSSGGTGGSMGGNGGSTGGSLAGGGSSNGGSGGAVGGSGGGATLDAREMLEKLTGAKPINGKDTIAHRYTETERDLAREYLLSVFASLGLKGQAHDYPRGKNIYAELPATTESKQYLITGGHFDSVQNSPAADDNATGTVMTLLLAADLARLKVRSKHVLFVAFDGEEVGHLGSTAFAKWVKEKAIEVHSVHVVDMIGWDSDHDRTIELQFVNKNNPRAQEFLGLYQKAVKDAGVNGKIQLVQHSGTDHNAFDRQGFPAFALGEEYVSGDTSPHYHAASDKVSTLDLDYYEMAHQVIRQALTELLK